MNIIRKCLQLFIRPETMDGGCGWVALPDPCDRRAGRQTASSEYNGPPLQRPVCETKLNRALIGQEEKGLCDFQFTQGEYHPFSLRRVGGTIESRSHLTRHLFLHDRTAAAASTLPDKQLIQGGRVPLRMVSCCF